MLAERGYLMTCYDPYFAPNTKALKQTYDFVTCSEVVEHFNQPARSWHLLLEILKTGGWLGVMTTLINDLNQFPELPYITDVTHVSFYSRRTFRFLARQNGLRLQFLGDQVILIHKPDPSQELSTA
jgi:2-polyprenyl-3-methyl-5-hydroxy-6-metoxy-1,4-benzoquinol methylase